MSETLQDILNRIKEWPTQPGVYIMRDLAQRILYVGKAKNLKSRIRSYFLNPEKITGKTRILVKKIASVEFTVTNTELEALLLECNLIKKHRPRYNIRLKDDKNFPYVVLDFTHPFPQFRITRKILPSPHLKYFGPYSAGVREIGRFLLKTFQIRDCSDAKFRNRKRPCLNYEIGTCTAPCVALVTEEDYGKQVREATLFLKGKKQELLSELKKEMKGFSERQEFEQAKVIRDKIAAVEMLTQKQDAILPDRLRDIDIIGSFRSGNDVQWVVLFIRAGFLIGRRAEKVTLTLDSPEELARQFIEQFYTVSILPDEIWIAEDIPDREGLSKLLSEKAEKPVAVKLKRGEKPMRLLGMAHENAKLLFLDSQKGGGLSGAERLREALELAETPHTIEGIDVSNIQGQNPAVALVHFAGERPLKSQYRIYYPKTVEGQNDFAMIYETVLRRFSNVENSPPDLLMIDGGKGQLQSAIKALEELKLEIPVCSLAKARTESAFTRKEVQRSEERIFVPNRKNPIVLRETDPGLRLLQQVRDEAHRFSVKSHRVRRTNEALKNSPLEELEGIGEKNRIKLLKHFGSLEKIRMATVDELVAAGIGRARALALVEYFAVVAGSEATKQSR